MARWLGTTQNGMIALALFVSVGTVSAQSYPATSTASPATSPTKLALRIVVSSVQGQVEVRATPNDPWRLPVVGEDLLEGCEFRTGPHGVIQFKIEPDQVFRADRLSLVRVLRCNLENGRIKTIVGMTYGRISKDVDAPVCPHEDTIVSPSSTLAVRGTRVSLYDQPPYAPEAVSLTGAAIFENLRGQLVHFGAKNGGTAKVAGNASAAVQSQLPQTVVDPSGNFSGQTVVEDQFFQDQNQILNKNFAYLLIGQTKFTSLVGISTNEVGYLQFPMLWNDSAKTELNSPQTVVNYVVQGPQGEIVTPTSVGSTPSGGHYVLGSGQSDVASSTGFGNQEIDWGSLTQESFPTGTYTITETLEGTTTQTLSQDPTIRIKTTTSAQQVKRSGAHVQTPSVKAVLDSANPTVVYTVTVPITRIEQIALAASTNSVRAADAKAPQR